MACQADGLGGRDLYLHACSEMILYSCLASAWYWAKEARVSLKICAQGCPDPCYDLLEQPYAEFSVVSGHLVLLIHKM